VAAIQCNEPPATLKSLAVTPVLHFGQLKRTLARRASEGKVSLAGASGKYIVTQWIC
jgi:hypothetical protein